MDSRLAFLLFTLLLYTAFSIHLPLRDYLTIDFGWITALTLASIIKSRWIFWSISIGFLSAFFIPLKEPVILQDSIYKILGSLLTLLCIVFSAFIFRRISLWRTKTCWPGMIAILACLVWLTLLEEQKKIAVVYLSAAVISGILLCLKNKTLSFLPFRMLLGWLTGYLPWFLIISSLDLNPFTTFQQNTIVLTYLLIPFPVYTLQILIGSHISDAIQNAETHES